MYIRFPEGKMKAVTLSYDDGVVEDIRLSEILKQNGIKCTFNINTGYYLGEEEKREIWKGRLKRSEAIALYKDSGNEVAVHTLTHPQIADLSTAEMVTEVIEDRKNIERDYGTIARGMAYPNGSFSPEVVNVLRMCGIRYSRTTHSTKRFDLPKDWLLLDPTCHHNDPELMELAKRFAERPMRFSHEVRLFYLWGHSYEFREKDNWNVIEAFADYIGGRSDVWYATNIEICDYVHAFRSLEWSVDGNTVFNPTSTDVWFTNRKETYCVHAGEILRIS
ncbi:MAG: polysaccharide deacetylase family protein [Lachnospiraceae bacterium]|nr:polysaccharide deacetylase family protein [Lachnospiraceae bacterium]